MSADGGDGAVGALPSENGAGPSAGPQPSHLTASSAPMRPEVAVGAAFAGGFLLAVLLRRARS